jgi:transglutaminase-like putative cysteine protease/tetratricopeptide (TPR) repeat protein
LYAGQLAAEPEVGVLPVPDWADELSIEAFESDRSGQFQFGIAYLLSDRQVRKSDAGYDYVERLAYEVVERSGLEAAATITLPFDPEQASLSFNFVRVLRDGDIIDKLDMAEVTLLRQEQGLSANIVSGYYTAVLHLEDIRVGDVIDYSYSGSVASQLWPGHLFDSVLVEWSMPIAQLRFRLEVPGHLAIDTRSLGTDIEPAVSTKDRWTRYEVHVRDPDPVTEMRLTPEDWIEYGFVTFSTMKDWSEVVDWALPVFAVDPSLPAEFTARLDEIAQAYPSREERAIRALRLVQEDIRYLGLEVGLGSHIPRPPSLTLERGYGDCKDKSVLLIAALDYLGIDAVPALASTFGGRLLPTVSPTISGFNHVIVGIDIDEHRYWVDPTLIHQGGRLDNMASPDYGYVLPVQEAQSELVKIDIPFSDSPRYESRETYSIAYDGDVGLLLSVQDVYRGASADAMRLLISGVGEDQVARSFLDSYAGKYPGLVERTPASFSDDIDANVIVIDAEYEMDMETFRSGELDERLPVYATAAQDIIPKEVEAGRTTPLRLAFGTHKRHVIRVQTPGRSLSDSPDKTRSIAGIDYKREIKSEGDIFEIDYTLTVKQATSGLVPLKTITDLGEEIARDTTVTVNVGRAKRSLVDRLGLQEPIDPETEAALVEIEELSAKQQYVDVLTALNQLLTDYQEPSEIRGLLQLQRGRVLSWLGRKQSALQPMGEGIELYQKTVPSDHWTYFELLMRHGSEEQGAEAMRTMLERHPTTINQFDANWTTRFLYALQELDLNAARESLIVAIAEALDETRSARIEDFEWIVSEAVTSQIRAGRASDAVRYVRHIHNPETLAVLLTKRETKPVWEAIEDAAGPGLSIAVSEYVERTRKTAFGSPDDYWKQINYLEALRIAGRFEDALLHAEPYLENWSRIEATGSDAYWFVNSVAYILTFTGRTDKALALLGRLAGLGIRENEELVSIEIHRIGTLIDWGRFEEVLESVDALEQIGRDIASDRGWAWIYSFKACALHQTGRSEEAHRVLEESIEPVADSAPSAYTKVMVCFGDVESAANSVIDRLRKEAYRDDIILSLLVAGEQVAAPPTAKQFIERSYRVRSMPRVKAEFEKVGRVIEFEGIIARWPSL